MAKTRKTDRKNCQQPDFSIPLSPTSPRKPNTIVDTPRRTRLLRDAKLTAGKIPRRELFKKYNIAEKTGYRIIKSDSTRRSQLIHNRGRKPVLAPHERDAIETVENASFRFGTQSHYANANAMGVAHGSERAIQRNMAQHGVGTYMALQKKYIKQTSIEQREIWGFKRRYW